MKSKKTGIHPIQVVAQRTGLSADVLRVWERRYGVIEPARSDTGRRLYSDEDVDHLILLRRATMGGRSIGQVTGLGRKELGELIRSDEKARLQTPRAPDAQPGRSGPGKGSPSSSRIRHESLEAIRLLDPERLEKALSLATIELAPATLIDEVVVPVMWQVGESWSKGEIRVVHEHLASAVVRTFLGAHATRAPLSDSAPHIVVGTPAAQRHELGAMIVVAAASASGWQSTYLGPDLPAEELAAGVHQKDASAIGLSIIYPADDIGLVGQLRELRRLLPKTTEIIVGGASAAGYAKTISEIGARFPKDLSEFRSILEELRLERAGL